MDVGAPCESRTYPPAGLSHPSRAAIAPALGRIRATDKGAIRASNDKTACSRSQYFIDWGASKGFSDLAFEFTSPFDAGQILAAFAQEVTEGCSIKRTSQPNIKTVQGYVRAAAKFATSRGFNDPRFIPDCINAAGKRIYHPLLASVFETTGKWTPSKHPECMPITVAILADLCNLASSSPAVDELLLPAVIRDAAILGTFTGSRVSEYAQGKVPKGTTYSKVSSNTASGEEGGRTLAFHRLDFRFYSAGKVELSGVKIAVAAYLEVRFRYTKGVRTWVFRMFAAIPGSPFCPVTAGIRVVSRWSILRPGSHTPLFCFKTCFFSSSVSYLRDTHMTAAFRQSARRVYPDPAHVMHQRATSLASKSLRVFACLSLKLAGWDEETISHQLRWSSDAVKFYVRQSTFHTDSVGASLFKSALVL